ncbi:MAG TPA: hypothetical protein VNY82_19255 [Steroidobacteraceae bacterium]|nr:hypothetical protein [Steroidobacteraceae bacterium]
MNRVTQRRAHILGIAALTLGFGSIPATWAEGRQSPLALEGRVVAEGIPGVSAISVVGVFLAGGPIHDKPPLAAYTQPGAVLDPVRLLVASNSNFGEPLANLDQLPGSVLSIDPRGSMPLIIPAAFAAAGGQVSALGGLLQMYSAQSGTFQNSLHNPGASTARYTGVSNPLGLSINNAFGRIWPANAPYGLEGIGSSSIDDPTGEPLAGAPDPQLGGVYAGDLTPRLPVQSIPGALTTGAIGTALLGRSPDGSTKAVFAVVTADGAVVQESTLMALDGLAPAGTVYPVLGRRWSDDMDDSEERRGAQPRVGVLVNYSPTRVLFVSEPLNNSIAALSLSDDGVVFHVASVRHFSSEALDEPIDMAPVTIESSDPNWASNTTLDVLSDFYIANRGNNTIVRMQQDGTVVAVRKLKLHGDQSLGHARVNGIASSPDGTKIWVTVSGRLPGRSHSSGAVLELPSF